MAKFSQYKQAFRIKLVGFIDFMSDAVFLSFWKLLNTPTGTLCCLDVLKTSNEIMNSLPLKTKIEFCFFRLAVFSLHI